MLARGVVTAGSVTGRQAGPGDVLASGESYATLTTAGAGTILGAMFAAGILHRTGPGGGYTDTTDTAENILIALAGNDYKVNVMPGTTFRFLFRNTVAFLMTFAAGLGVIAGTGITAGSRVSGVTIGDQTSARGQVDKITAITLNQNSASAQSSTSVTFSPCIRFNGCTERKIGRAHV